MSNSRKSRLTKDGFKAPRVRKRMFLDDAHLELTRTIKIQAAIEQDPKTTIAEKNAAGHLKNQCIGTLNRLLEQVKVAEKLASVEERLEKVETSQSKGLRRAI